MNAEKFLSKFFAKLTEKDFRSDRCLSTFYRSYCKELEPELDSEGKLIPKEPIELFIYFLEYLTRNKTFDAVKKKAEIHRLCAEIKEAIFNPKKEEEDINPRIGRKQEEPTAPPIKKTKKIKVKVKRINKKTGETTVETVIREVPIEENPRAEQPARVDHPARVDLPTSAPVGVAPRVLKLNKAHALNVLSDMIKQSFITIDTNLEDKVQVLPDEAVITDEAMRDNMAALVLDETKRKYTRRGEKFPTPRQDAAFNRKNEILEIWRDTETYCIEFREKIAPMLSEIMKKVYVLDGLEISDNSSLRTMEIRTDDKKNIVVPSELIKSRRTNTVYNTNVCVLNSDILSETLRRVRACKICKKQCMHCALLCAGSRWIPGGGSDQGIETNETPLYLSSSYHVSLDRLNSIYPLDNRHVIVSPKVLVIKDHTQARYPRLSLADATPIAVINSAPPYPAETTLVDQKKNEFDTRLYESSVEYRTPQKLIDQLTYTFNTALFFGYDTIILDDRGVEDFHLPADHTARLLSLVINRFKTKFKEIIVAIRKPTLYEIYRRHIS